MSKAVAAVIIAALVLGIAPASAEWSSEEPPARYVEASASLTIFVRYKSQSEVDQACWRPSSGPLPTGWVLYGCSTAQSLDGLCIITISDSLPATVSPAQIERHERAHCAGWRH